MITSLEVAHLSPVKQLHAYAYAYRDGAARLCEHMVTSPNAANWPNSAVVLMLSAHSVELFLKGAILHRARSGCPENHRIPELTETFRELYPEPAFAWDVPFQVDYSLVEKAQIPELRKAEPQPSILYRYPFAKAGKDWGGLFGFEPGSFSPLLDALLDDFTRIERLLNA